MTTNLSATQHTLLERALLDHGGRITSDLIKSAIPHVKGGAVSRVMTALSHQGLVAYHADGCYVTPAAGPILFPEQPCIAEHGPNGACPECAIDPDAEDGSSPTDRTTDSAPTRERRTRANSKQAQVIRMLETGATIEEICAVTNWQTRTVRGFFAGALKKRGIRLTSTKTDAGRIYRIEHATA